MITQQVYATILQSIESLRNISLKSANHISASAENQWIGIKTSDLRKWMLQNKKNWLSIPLSQRIELVETLYKSHIGEQAEIATYLLNISIPEFDSGYVLLLDRFADHFQGWGTVDDFCINVLQPLLLKFPEETVKLIRTWNLSQNPWKRRSSMVVFVRKIGRMDKYTDLCIELAENLLYDSHNLVLKGVGWALKDMMRGNKDKVLTYVKSLRQRNISSIITLYAIRDLKGKEREAVLTIKGD